MSDGDKPQEEKPASSGGIPPPPKRVGVPTAPPDDLLIGTRHPGAKGPMAPPNLNDPALVPHSIFAVPTKKQKETTTQEVKWPGAPSKCIMTEPEVARFVQSPSAGKLRAFVEMLSMSVRGQRVSDAPKVEDCSPAVKQLMSSFAEMRQWVSEIPLEDQKLQRFGNRAFRTWHQRLHDRWESIVLPLLNLRPQATPMAAGPQRKPTAAEEASGEEGSRSLANASASSESSPGESQEQLSEDRLLAHELAGYLFDSFGNASRIDYGTGHETHFVLFLYVLNEVEVLAINNYTDEATAVALRVFWEYISFMRLLQSHYRLEPAGSHGVHGLDDFHHIPFILGAAQCFGNKDQLESGDSVKPEMVSKYRKEYFYFEMVGWIHDNKRGPFHEHSSTLWNVSSLTWEKIMVGMGKMYDGEVIGRFNVVQHMLFGKHFSYN